MGKQDSTIYSLKQILNKVPLEKDFLRLTPILYGKILKGIPFKSKITLTLSEITYYRISLKYAYENWHVEGDKEWIVVLISGPYFTVKFIRKYTKEEERYKKELANKR